MRHEPVDEIRARLSREVGRIDKIDGEPIALVYPSPYRAGMSSLGFQQIYKLVQGTPGLRAERIFLPDDPELASLSYESLQPLREFRILAFSVAYELELAGMVTMLDAAGIAPLREDRGPEEAPILAGGPLTFSNPLPLAAFADVIVMGEADEIAIRVFELVSSTPDKAKALAELATWPHLFVPSHHGDTMPTVARAEDSVLPAWGPIRSPDTELANMFLIETERGCSRACTYCVMRRSTNGGMRLVTKEKILGLIPEDAERVGLVGAAVSDHPKITEIVHALADRKISVGLSSLRPDRLSDAFVGALARAGHRTLTTAMDGPSERLRESLERRARIKHLTKAAELARAHGMKRLKLYLMVGLPTETDEDIDECSAFVTELSKTVPIALGIAPFCAKRNTPLDGAAFAGIDVVRRRLDRLRRGLKGRADVRSTSARWAWVEYILAQGGIDEGKAVVDAVRAGGRFADYERAFEHHGKRSPRRRSLAIAPI